MSIPSNNCPSGQDIQAYHDGELDPARLEAVAGHLAECGPCARILQQLSAMSAVFGSASVPRLSQIAMHRLHRRIEAAMDRGLLRIAWGISGVAAAILVCGWVLLSTMNSVKPAAPVEQAISTNMTVETPPWVGTTASADTAALVRESATPVAEWYLANPSYRADDSQ